MKFEWDARKNESNFKKHRIRFEEAKSIFSDETSIEFEATRNKEYRIVRIGKTAAKFILLVVYTIRNKTIRVISARQASKKERNLYISRKLKKNPNGDTNS